MKPIASLKYLAFTITLFLSAFPACAQKASSLPVPTTARTLAASYLRSIQDTSSYGSGKGQKDFIFVGTSVPPSNGWRIIVVRMGRVRKPQLIWDSFSLRHDEYFTVSGLSNIHTDADGPDAYVVTLRGCFPHDCTDGRIGFALFASRTDRVYVSHITTTFRNLSSGEVSGYKVAYYPAHGIPENYHLDLDRMMCGDSGISEGSLLPIRCSPK